MSIDYQQFALRLEQRGYQLMSRWEQYIPPKLSPLQIESKVCFLSWFNSQEDNTVLLEVTIDPELNVLNKVINVYHQKSREVTDEQIVDWLDKHYHDYLLVPPGKGQFLWGLYKNATLVASGRSVRDCMISYLRLEI